MLGYVEEYSVTIKRSGDSILEFQEQILIRLSAEVNSSAFTLFSFPSCEQIKTNKQ